MIFPTDIKNIIIEYINNDILFIVDIENIKNKIIWNALSCNKEAVLILKNNKNKIVDALLSSNENGEDLIKEKIKNKEYVNMSGLSGNKNIVHI